MDHHNASNQLNPSSDRKREKGRALRIPMSDEELNEALNEALNEQLNLVTPDMKVIGTSQLPLNVVRPLLVDLTGKEENDDNTHMHERQTKEDEENESTADVPKESDLLMNHHEDYNNNTKRRDMTPDDSITQALQDDDPSSSHNSSGKKSSDTISKTHNTNSPDKNNLQQTTKKTTNNKENATTDNNHDTQQLSEASLEKNTSTNKNNNNDHNNNNNNDTNNGDLINTNTSTMNETTPQSHTSGVPEVYQPGLPKRYEVLVQARVREKRDLDSSHITDLPEGTTVTVAEIDGRRARIITPIHGWLSIKSKFGAKILLPLDGNHSKVGHQVYITDQQSNARYAGKIVDYNEVDCKHVVRLNDGQELLVDINAPNIKVVKDTEHMREARNRLSGDAPAFDPKASKQSNSLYLFHKLLWKDHPEFVKEEHERAQVKQQQRWMAQQNAQAHMSDMAAHTQRGGNPMYYHPNMEDASDYPLAGYPPTMRAPLPQPQPTNGTMRYNQPVIDAEKRGEHMAYPDKYPQGPPPPMGTPYYQQMRGMPGMRTEKSPMVDATQVADAQKSRPKKRARGLIVLRGLPGSGKTTLAKKLAARHGNAQICTEDKYHWSSKEDGVGEYKFRPELVFLAREWCSKEIRSCIKKHVDLIVLDNHNARISMYEDHIQYAVRHGYRFRIIEFVATEELIDKYRQRSYKKFPREVFVKLLKLWEKDPRAELVNPAFDENSGDTNPNNPNNNNNNINNHTNDNFGNSKDKERNEINPNVNGGGDKKEHNLDNNQKEVNKKGKGIPLRNTNDPNNKETSGIDTTSHNTSNITNNNNNNGTNGYAEWDTDQSQYPLA